MKMANIKMNMEDLINKRLLIEEQDWLNPIEVNVLEMSPSKQYMKLQKIDKLVYWIKASSIKIIEVLN